MKPLFDDNFISLNCAIANKPTLACSDLGCQTSAITGAIVRSSTLYYVDIPLYNDYYKTLFNSEDEKFTLETNTSFTIRFDILMRYGKDQARNNALSDYMDVVFLRRGLFTLD